MQIVHSPRGSRDVEHFGPARDVVELEAAGGRPNPSEVQQRLEQVSGVSRVVMKDSRNSRLAFEVESLPERQIRAELARTIVNSGWSLNEMRSIGLSLEDIFLQLTTSEEKEPEKVGVTK